MGRRPYMNLLALGRSPYEAPESPPGSREIEPQANSANADGYVQAYDARGHPINPDSKRLGKQLRRAKNDVLSTMGIVVSGEDGNQGVSKERQRVKQLVAENDWGLALATLDQVVSFVSSWWTTSLVSRIQTFERYTHIPLADIMRQERARLGLFGFYFAGIPAWSISFFLSVCRNHFLDIGIEYVYSLIARLSRNKLYKKCMRELFTGVYYSAQTALFFVVGQMYMFAVLQSLSIIPATAIPTFRMLLPFGQSSLVQLPPLPTDLSATSVGLYSFNTIMAPFTMVYMYVHLRPMVESRIYRILRRRLPKPDRPDNLSIRIAVENDLVEWTVPTLGGRSEEETRRSNLTLLEELKHEIHALKSWIWGLFRRQDDEERNRSADLAGTGATDAERYDALRERIEQFRAMLPSNRNQEEETIPRQTRRTHGQIPGDSEQTQSAAGQHEEIERHADMALPGGEPPMVQSPGEYAEGRPAAARHGMDEPYRSGPETSASRLQREDSDEARQREPPSRSNTLFSRRSSPDSSPPTSPRVRASLVHQNSDVITMQLELLQSAQNSNARNQNDNNNAGATATDNIVIPSVPAQHAELDIEALDRAATELLDSLLLQQNNRQLASITDQHDAVPNAETNPVQRDVDRITDGNVDLSGGEVPQTAGHLGPADTDPHNALQLQPTDTRESPTGHRHGDPDTDADDEPQDMRPFTNRSSHRRSRAEHTPADHRVSILSLHPADALSSHIASLLASALLYPLESMYLRRMASSFLSSQYLVSGALPLGAAAATVGLRSDVRGMELWFGGGTRRDMLAYVGKMVLVLGVETAVSAGVWAAGTAAAVLLGKKKFGWGLL